MPERVTKRNAKFQQWQALLTNRAKRTKAGEFLVHGVRPITMAFESGWPVTGLLHDPQAAPSNWAAELLGRAGSVRVEVATELLAELGEKDEGPPELIAVVRAPDDDTSRIRLGPSMLVVVVDRPASPGNLGTMIRSAEALGAGGVIVTGHAADVYDPRTIRASTGVLFAVPVVRVGSPADVLSWARSLSGLDVRVVGADGDAEDELWSIDMTGPLVVVVGNERTGLSRTWRDGCDKIVRIPLAGSTASLNAAAAGTVLLYEATRQRASKG